MNYCKNCGQELTGKSSYCLSCGSYVKEEKFSVKEQEVKFCPECGSESGKIYCGNCGSYTKKVYLVKKEDFISRGVENITKKIGTNQQKKVSNIIVIVIGISFICVILILACITKNIIGDTVEKKSNVKSMQSNTNNENLKEESVLWERYTKNGRVGFKDAKGNVKIPAEYINVGTFSENGLAKVVGENHLFGYMDYTGEIVIEEQFEDAGDFASNGLACVWKNGKAGYINEYG